MEGESHPALLLQRQIVQASLLEHLSAVIVGRRECAMYLDRVLEMHVEETCIQSGSGSPGRGSYWG